MSDAAQTPLIDLLRSVPMDGRDVYEVSPIEHHNIPYGRLCKEAADAIDQLRAENAQLKDELEANLQERVRLQHTINQYESGDKVSRHYACPDCSALKARVGELEATTTKAQQDVLKERRRQVEVEGWDEKHDDEHSNGGMAIAAACYALVDKKALEVQTVKFRRLWEWTGWSILWFKPKDIRSNLIRAAALLVAEIERLDRTALKVCAHEPDDQDVCIHCGAAMRE